MIVTLIGEKKINSIRLPKKKSGQFWITDREAENGMERLLGIDADRTSERWKITSGKYVQIYDTDSKQPVKTAFLENNEILFLRIGQGLKEGAFLLTEEFTEDRCQFVKYPLVKEGEIHIGSSEKNDIVIRNKFVSSEHAVLTVNNGKWIIRDRESANGVYVNQRRIHKESTLSGGDIIYIMGCKIIVGDGFIAMNNPDHQISVSKDYFTIYKQQRLEAYEEPELEYKPFYYRSPNFKRKIDKLELKIDLPTQKVSEDKTPIILTVAPTMMMGIASLVSGIMTTIGTMGKGGSIITVIPTLVMTVSMLCGMVVFPIIMKKRERKLKKEKEAERIEKYLKYLQNIRHEIDKAKDLQSKILRENHPNIIQYVGSQDFYSRKLWNMKKADEDFMCFRIGVGNVPLAADIAFPDERFSVEEDELREALVAFSEEKQVITDVPLDISLCDFPTVGIYGDRTNRFNLLHNILLQLDALYSYDEVKLIFLGDSRDEEEFSYVKWMQHIWNDEHDFRYYAINFDDIKEINVKVQKLLQNMEEDKNIDCHYVVISISKMMADKASFVSDILSGKAGTSFHYICAYENLNQLPKECNVLVTLNDGHGLIDYITGEEGRRTNFAQDSMDSAVVSEVVHRIADISLDLQKGKYTLPGMLTFLDMFKVGNIEHLNIRQRWQDNNPTLSLQTPVGVDENGGTFYLDLHEKYHGPHGLVAGMTGSGKSEFIITFILSLAVNYHPDEVAFVLIDYKGGGLTGAFENDKYRLPHLAGTITNLDGAAITRSILSIRSELRKRQEIFNKARRIANEGTMDIYKYQKMYRSGAVTEAVPHLFIISDEFAELKTQQPEFMEQLISTARIGRSLGVHLILATQKPSGVVNEQIWSNSKFKVCLKVQNKADSMDMLKRADAAEIAETGRFYLQVGYNEIFEKGQSAWCGAPYFERDVLEEELDSSVEIIDHVGNIVENIKVSKEGAQTANGKQIVRIMEYLSELAEEEKIHERQLWLPEIPSIILLQDIKDKYGYTKKESLSACIGEIDDPYNQSQKAMILDFEEKGNTVVYGSAGSGKEMFLATMLYSLYEDYSASELNAYILDFGAETLKVFGKAPQTGDVIVEGQNEKVDRLLTMITKEMERRKKLFSEYGGDFQSYRRESACVIPQLVVVINNYSAFIEEFEKYEANLISLTRDCTKYGLYFVITEANANGIRYRMMQNINQVYVLGMNDKSEYVSLLGSTNGVYPPKVEGRGIFKEDETYIFQIAHIIENSGVLNAFLREKYGKYIDDNIPKAQEIHTLPEQLRVEDVLKNQPTLENVPYGIYTEDFEVATHDFYKKDIMLVLAKKLDTAKNYMGEVLRSVVGVEEVEIRIFSEYEFFEEAQSQISRISSEKYEEGIRNMFHLAVERNNHYKDTNGAPTMDMHPVIFVFFGFSSIREKLSDDGRSKLDTVLEKTRGIYNLGYIVADTVDGANKFSANDWYLQKCSGEGIWIGEGFNTQIRMQVSEDKSKLDRSVNSTLAYVVDEGEAKLCKLVTMQGGSEDE